MIMSSDNKDWNQFWIDLIKGLEDSREVLKVVLAIIGTVSGGLALYLQFSNRPQKQNTYVKQDEQ